jgi:DNA-binding beta-propeller fold protein YncE
MSGGSDTVTPMNTTTNTAGKPTPVGHNPDFIAITPDGTTAYADTSSGTVTPINTAGKPIKVAATPLLRLSITP